MRGAGGDTELGLGAEYKKDGAEHERVEHGQMNLDSLRAFVEAGLRSFDARLDQQVDMLAQTQECCRTPSCQATQEAEGSFRGAHL